MLTFPGYEVKDGQELILVIQVPRSEDNYVVYQLADPSNRYSNLAVNSVPDVGDGPLAFAHLEAGSGLRAAIHGDQPGRVRFALAAISSVLVAVLHPLVLSVLCKLLTVGRRLTARPGAWVRGLGVHPSTASTRTKRTAFARLFATPWYPWPAAMIPILHFLTSNPLHFEARDVVVPLVLSLAIVTVSVGVLWTLSKDWHRPAVATLGAIVIFFAYGHVESSLAGKVDERVFFASAVVLGATVVVVTLQAGELSAKCAQFANLTVAILLVFPIVGLVQGAASSSRALEASLAPSVLASHLPLVEASETKPQRPDIYYIILDSYGRHDTFKDYDNWAFLTELERRGFYVALEATSNYRISIHSIPSSLNLTYLTKLGNRSPATELELAELSERNALASVLKSLGYVYVHLESGYEATDKSSLADISVTFMPAGVFVSGAGSSTVNDRYGHVTSGDSLLSSRFTREFLRTTALRPITEHPAFLGEDEPYAWWSGQRALQMFDFLASPLDVGGPKFVFAHIVKPHPPTNLDQYGNVAIGSSKRSQFNDAHDPSVPSAYIGQLIGINTLVLRMVDELVRRSGDNSVIVIAGDHSEARTHDILAAFRLPGDGNDGLYPTISSVNHFRYILDYYFGFNIGLLEDRLMMRDITDHDFRVASEGED